MATRRPIVLVSGVQAEMPRGDVIDTGLNVTLQPNPSGLYFTGDNKLGFDGQGDNIQVIASGVNAVYRTVQDKGRDIVSVKDFGAVGNGMANDTAAIQAAITQAAIDGKTVYMPAGNYNANIVLNAPNVSIIGDGKSTIVSPSSGDVLTCQGIASGNGALVSNLRLTGATGAQRGLVVSGFSRGSIKQLYIDEIDTGIYINGDASTETFFDNIYCYNVASYGVRYERTNTVDTGGVYFNTISVTGTSSAIGMSFNSTAGASSRAFAFITNAVLDNRAQPALYIKNCTNFFVTQAWVTGTAPSAGLVHLDTVKDIWLQGAYVQNSSASGYNFFVDGLIQDLSASVLRVSGPGTAWYFGGTANVANRCRVYSYNSTASTRTNDNTKASLLLSPTPSAFINAGAEQTATISSGSIAVTSSRVLVLGEGGTTDDLDTITGGNTADLLFLTFGATGYTITVKHATGNIRLANGVDEVLSGPNEVIAFVKRNNGSWLELSRSNNP